MNYKLGDFVRFVDENLEGYVTRIIDKDTLGVTDANDFEIPVLASKVTLVHGDIPTEPNYVKTSSSAKAIPQKEFIKEGVFLAIVSDQHSSSVVHFYLINQSSFQLLLSLSTEKDEKFRGETADILAPASNKRIYSAQLADIQIWPKLRLEILFHTDANIEAPEAIIFKQSFRGRDLSIAKTEIPQLKQKGWLFRLDEKEQEKIIDAEKLKQSFFK